MFRLQVVVMALIWYQILGSLTERSKRTVL